MTQRLLPVAIDDAERARDMGRQGRRFVQDSWDNVVAAEKFIKIVKEIRAE